MANFLLQEDGVSFILQEDGSKIILQDGASASPSVSPSSSFSPSSSRSPSASHSPSSSSSHSISPSSSRSPSASASASMSPSPSQGYSIYSRGDDINLPTGIDDLETLYTDQEELTVSTRNNAIVSQTGNSQYMLHQFRIFIDGALEGDVEWEGITDLSPCESPVYLQLYNFSTQLWETIDTEQNTAENMNFELGARIPDFTAYKNAMSIVLCRVYQISIGSHQLSTDYFGILIPIVYATDYPSIPINDCGDPTPYIRKYPPLNAESHQ